MKVVNYTSTPLVLHGKTYTDKEIFLPENYKTINLRHNNRNISGGDVTSYTHLYITELKDGTFYYHYYDQQIPDLTVTTIALISAVGFCLFVKIIQKLKTS